MSQENYLFLGYIAKPHGYKGALNVFVTAEGFNHTKITKIFLELNESLVPFFLHKIEHKNGDKYVVYLDGVINEVEALKLVGKKIFISKNDVHSSQKNIFQTKDLIGFQVFDQENHCIGCIQDVFETSAHPILQVLYQDKLVLIPLAHELILKFEHTSKKIFVQIPNGILNI